MKEMKGQWLADGRWLMPNGVALEDRGYNDRTQLEALEAALIEVLGNTPLPRYAMTRVEQGESRLALNVRRGNDWMWVVIGSWSSRVEHTYASGCAQIIPRVRSNRFFYEVYRGGSSGGPDHSGYCNMLDMLQRLIAFCQQRDMFYERMGNQEMNEPTADVVPLFPTGGRVTNEW